MGRVARDEAKGRHPRRREGRARASRPAKGGGHPPRCGSEGLKCTKKANAHAWRVVRFSPEEKRAAPAGAEAATIPRRRARTGAARAPATPGTMREERSAGGSERNGTRRGSIKLGLLPG